MMIECSRNWKTKLFVLCSLVILLNATALGASITAVRIPTSIASGGGAGSTGYPYAVYVSIQGWTTVANSQAYVKLYNGSNNEWMWSATGVWSNNTAYSSSNQPVVNIDAGGNWSGWIYAKHNDNITGTFNLRAAKVGATSTNLTQTGIAFTSLNMLTTGGWVVRSSSPAVNKGLLAYSGSTIVGTYRSEDNGITEGYSYSAGGFKIAVPAGIIDSIVSINDDGTRDQVFVGPWSVSAGSETDVSTGGVPFGYGTAKIEPSTIPGASSQSITVKIFGQASHTLTNAKVVVHPTFTWSHSASDVTLVGGGSPSKSVTGDTIIVSSMTLSGTDSLQIQVADVTPPDSTDYFEFKTLTGTSPDSIYAIAASPKVLVYGTPKPIGDIKVNDANGVPIYLNRYVTIRGVVTVANQFGSPSFVQDNTGGIGVYGSIFSHAVNIGDEVLLTGIVNPFYGLAEINYPILHQILSSGNTVAPLVVTCSQVFNDGVGGVETYEGLLVRLNAVVVRDTFNNPIPTWAVTGSGTNYRLTDASGNLAVRVDDSVSFRNTPAPQGQFDIIGVVGQYKTSAPYIGGYQLMPRDSADILAKGPIIASLPVESNITSTSMRISWTTMHDGTSRLRYGTTTAYELGVLAPDDILRQSHAIDMSSLLPATIYHVQVFSVANGDTSVAGDLVVSTASPPASTGTMNVYFNNSVDASVSMGEVASGYQNLVDRLVQRINTARRSIDVCLYSLSGPSQGDVIASALVAAKNRGVKIRVVCEYDNSSSSSFQTLVGNGIPLITDRYDLAWAGQALMHNKFLVLDGRGGAPESVWVWTGSWNPTYEGTVQDRQNSIEIQDKALAGAFTTEFNAMWGDSTDTPNQSMTRFGGRKLDVVPHHFVVNGVPISVYFSPSDRTTSRIKSAINRAQHSVSGAIMTITRKDVADTLIGQKNLGRKVRLVLDNNTDIGSQYSYLSTNGVDIHLKGGSGILHHKYATIDGDQISGTPCVITGSHNWTNSAETSNDENTILVQSRRIANLYLQEFAARYYEAGGTDSIHVSNVAVFSASSDSLRFGSVLVGQIKRDSVTVTNIGSASLSITTAALTNPRFTVAPTNAVIAPLSARTFVVTFTPIGSGVQTGALVFTSNAASSPDSIFVDGSGVDTLAIAVIAPSDSLEYGAVSFGQFKRDSVSVTNNGNVSLHVTSVASSNPQYGVTPTNATIAPSSARTFVITFTPTMSGDQTGVVVFSSNAASSPDTVFTHGIGVDTITTASVTTFHRRGWNMISVPVTATDMRKATLFPTSISHAFAYVGTYDTTDTLREGAGYWLKFSASDSTVVVGKVSSHDTIDVKGSWNLIGSTNLPIPSSTIVQEPLENITSSYYGYNGKYTIADTLYPGKGYWVKVRMPGKLILSHLAGNSVASTIFSPRGLNSITITDAAGNQQSLYFGPSNASESQLDRFELPPLSPECEFDIRFASGRVVEIYANPLLKPAEIHTVNNLKNFPINIVWAIDCQAYNSYFLQTAAVRSPVSIELIGRGQAILTKDQVGSEFVIAIAPKTPLPGQFALGQNYPNPFNPTTTVPIAIPRSATVTMTIYNVLGEVVRIPIRDRMYEAGYYNIDVNATDLPSGLYFYELKAIGQNGHIQEFRDVKKFVLAK